MKPLAYPARMMYELSKSASVPGVDLNWPEAFAASVVALCAAAVIIAFMYFATRWR